jgi:hypothetical protein
MRVIKPQKVKRLDMWNMQGMRNTYKIVEKTEGKRKLERTGSR